MIARISRTPLPASRAILLRHFSADADAQKQAMLDELPKIFDMAMAPLLPMRAKMVDVVAEMKPDAKTVLDLASGPGEPAISLAKKFPGAAVISADNNEKMIGQAAKAAKEAGVSNVSTMDLDLLDLSPIATSSQHVVTVSLGLHILGDGASTSVEEIYRVLEPGGVMLATVWEDMPHLPVLEDAMTELIGAPPPMPFDPLGFNSAVANPILTAAGFDLGGAAAAHHDQVLNIPMAFGNVDDERTWKLGLIMYLPLLMERAGSDPEIYDKAQAAFARAGRARGFVNPEGGFEFTFPFRMLAAVKPA